MIRWALLQLLSYGVLSWLAFVGIAFLASRCGGWIGMFLGQCVVAGAVLVLDIDYATTHAYMDMDIVFTLGLLARVMLINTVLLPVSAIGIFLRRKRRKRNASGPGTATVPPVPIKK
jgi:hypothetical protein